MPLIPSALPDRRHVLVGIAAAATGFLIRSQVSAEELPGSIPRVAVLMGGYTTRDSAAGLEVMGLEDGLRALGWRGGENVVLDYVWPGSELDAQDAAAVAALGRGPDVVIARTTPTSSAVLRHTQTVPVIFVLISDPIAAGLAKSFAHPGGDATGFTNFEASVAGKWIELLRQVAPGLRHVVLLFNPDTTKAFYPSYLAAAREAAASYGLDVLAAPVTTIAAFQSIFRDPASTSGMGVVGIADAWITEHRQEIASALKAHRLPGVFANRALMQSGALLSYSVDYADIFRRSASYVDRILRGESPANLPVQAPTRYRLSVNLATARDIGVTVPAALLAVADEVIE